MTYYQQYLGQFYLGTSANNFSLGADAVTLTTGNYYITGYTGEATNQLCEHAQAQIRALGGTYATATVTYSSSTGKVTIYTGTASKDITWTDSALQTLLGFTGTQSGSATYVATNQARYVWRPTEGLSGYPIHIEQWFAPRSKTVVQRSRDGSITTVPASSLLYDGRYSYKLLPQADVITDSTTVWQSLEAFFGDVIHAGKPIRCYWDRTQSAASDVFTAVWPAKDEGIGSFADFAERHIRTYDGFWNVNFDLYKYIAPTTT